MNGNLCCLNSSNAIEYAVVNLSVKGIYNKAPFSICCVLSANILVFSYFVKQGSVIFSDYVFHNFYKILMNLVFQL